MPSKITLGGELVYPSNYLTAADLGGKDAVVEIESTNAEELTLVGGRKDKKKLILGFVGKKKKLVCNVTNANTLEHLFGTRAEDLIGKRITLYGTKTRFQGQMVDCIRIRETLPAGAKANA